MPEGDCRLKRFYLSRSAFFFAVILTQAFIVASCSFSNERVEVFSGSILITSDSAVSDPAVSDSSSVDLSDVVGFVIYDKEIDGLFDDTVIFYGDEQGVFTGVLRYEFPVNIKAPRLQRHVQLILPKLGVDTFMTVDVYSADAEQQETSNEWEPLVIHADSIRAG